LVWETTDEKSDYSVCFNCCDDGVILTARLQTDVILSPELLSVEVRRDRARGIITEQFPRVAGGMTNGIVAVIQSARIELPPLLLRNVDNLFLVEPGGASLLQLVSITMQYNDLVDTLAKQIAQNVNTFNPDVHRQALAGHLTAIGQALIDARREIGPIHDEATQAGAP
jgi:hypothetical protein